VCGRNLKRHGKTWRRKVGDKARSPWGGSLAVGVLVSDWTEKFFVFFCSIGEILLEKEIFLPVSLNGGKK